MPETMKSVFFYGLFMDQDVLEEKGFKPNNIRPARLSGFRLIIADKATLEPCDDAKSFGTVMELEKQKLDALYATSRVSEYVAQKVRVTVEDGKDIDAVTYVLPMHKVSGSNPLYAKKLVSIAKKNQLPDFYIKEIETWV